MFIDDVKKGGYKIRKEKAWDRPVGDNNGKWNLAEGRALCDDDDRCYPLYLAIVSFLYITSDIFIVRHNRCLQSFCPTVYTLILHLISYHSVSYIIRVFCLSPSHEPHFRRWDPAPVFCLPMTKLLKHISALVQNKKCRGYSCT